jgi:hypothetical protein
METTSEKIETRAHDLFVARNGNAGSQLEDWLKAEKEIEHGDAMHSVHEVHAKSGVLPAKTARLSIKPLPVSTKNIKDNNNKQRSSGFPNHR